MIKSKYLNAFLTNISDLYIKLDKENAFEKDENEIIDDEDLINEMEDFEEFNKINNNYALEDVINMIINFRKNKNV